MKNVLKAETGLLHDIAYCFDHRVLVVIIVRISITSSKNNSKIL